MELQVSWDRKDGVLIASPAGRVDSANSAEFQDALESGIPSEERALLLDFQHLSYMSSAGLRVLLVIARKFRHVHQTIGLCNMSGAIRSVVSLSGFDRIIPVHETLAEGLEAIPAEDRSGTPQPSPEETPAPDENRSGPREWSFKMHST